ncbi:MAG: energy transducer TonB [Hyphomonadaceae bacterium]|nr:energy transducer TonB [Hyphomonadaceae bacterium]
MLISATRTVSTFTMRALFYGALFVSVVIVHLGFTSTLRAQGWGASASLLASGAAVLAFVLIAVNVAEWVRERMAAHREMQRVKQRLPNGPCCVVWKNVEPAQESEDSMPWEVIGPLRARYPRLARRLGIEGVAVAEFEIGAGGVVKNVHCVHAWPSDVFFDAAREALLIAKFQPKGDQHVRFGSSYRMPFVFRIAGASKLKERGRRARKLRPTLHAAQQAVEKLRGTT